MVRLEQQPLVEFRSIKDYDCLDVITGMKICKDVDNVFS